MTLEQQDVGTAAESITVPRPHVPFGPQGVLPEVADAAYLHRAARDLEKHYRPFGSNLRARVVKLVHDAADAIAAGGTSRTPEYRVSVDESDPRDSVVVVDPDGRAWRIHREDADPEHRSTAYRLAAGWFGSLPGDRP